MSKTVEESDSKKSESNKTELENSTKKETYSTKGKLIFVYLSPDIGACVKNMPHICCCLMLPTKPLYA